MMNFFDKKSINSDDLETVEDLISIAKTVSRNLTVHIEILYKFLFCFSMTFQT